MDRDENDSWIGPDWTPADSAAALTEGWDIFLTERDDRDTYQIQVWHGCPTFSFYSDGRALGHVIEIATTGSTLHQKALAHCATIDPLSFAQDLAALIEEDHDAAF